MDRGLLQKICLVQSCVNEASIEIGARAFPNAVIAHPPSNPGRSDLVGLANAPSGMWMSFSAHFDTVSVAVTCISGHMILSKGGD